MRRLVIIFGCEGFIGRNLLDKISHDNRFDVLGVDKEAEVGYAKNNVAKLKLDILEKDSVEKIEKFLSGNDYKNISIVHLVGVSDVTQCGENKALAYKLNIESLKNACRICLNFDVKRIIFSSSALVYGTKYDGLISENRTLKPETLYAENKIEAEDYLLNNFSEIAVILRLSNVYGPDGNKNTVTSAALEQLRNNRLKLKEYLSMRDFLYIKDAITAFEAVLFGAPSFKVYNIGTSIGHSIYDFCSEAAKILHKEDLLPRIDEDVRPVNKLVLSCERIKNDLGWHPAYTLSNGITELVGNNGQ